MLTQKYRFLFRPAVCVLAISLLAAPVVAENAPPTGEENDGDEAAEYSANLPSWLRINAEARGRPEYASGLDFAPGANDGYVLSRLRLSVGFRPTSWLGLYAEGQDARVLGSVPGVASYGMANTVDLRQAYVDIGNGGGGGLSLRIGRQELAFGDERLVGADGFWDNLGITHDAVRAGYSKDWVRLDWFTSALVEPANHAFDRFGTGDRLTGFYSSFGAEDGVRLEPYFFWKHTSTEFEEGGPVSPHDVYTYGLRSAGELPKRLEYTVELVLQRGHVGDDGIRAWAGNWEIGWSVGGDDRSPSLGAGFSYASGDSDPDNGRRGTFDDLYPAGYNDAGIVDPFAWRNLKDAVIGFEWPFSDRWELLADYHSCWLASRKDGLYVDDGPYVVSNPGASSSRVGSQVNLMLGYTLSRHIELYGGFGRLIAGPYMQESGLQEGMGTAYMMCRFHL